MIKNNKYSLLVSIRGYGVIIFICVQEMGPDYLIRIMPLSSHQIHHNNKSLISHGKDILNSVHNVRVLLLRPTWRII